MDILGMIAIFVMGAIAFNFENNSYSIASEICEMLLKIFGMLLEIVALTYIAYKIIKGG